MPFILYCLETGFQARAGLKLTMLLPPPPESYHHVGFMHDWEPHPERRAQPAPDKCQLRFKLQADPFQVTLPAPSLSLSSALPCLSSPSLRASLLPFPRPVTFLASPLSPDLPSHAWEAAVAEALGGVEGVLCSTGDSASDMRLE